jgi:hypothetical protein
MDLNAVYRPSGLVSGGRDSARAHNVGDARREIQSHQSTICRPITEQFLAFLPEETAGDGDVVITLPKDDPAGDKTGPPLAVFRTMLSAISGNVFLGNAVHNRSNSRPHASTSAHGTGLVSRVEDEIRQVAAIAARYVFERFQLYVLDA